MWGVARGRGAGYGQGSDHGTTTASPLGTWKKEEPTSLSFNYRPRVHLQSTVNPVQLFCK